VIGLAIGRPPTLVIAVEALVIGALGYGLSITLWITAARQLGAARGQLIFATAPFIGALTAWVVLGEPISAGQLMALRLAAVGGYTMIGSSHLHEPHHDPLEHDHETDHDDAHHDPHQRQSVGRHSHSHQHTELVHAHAHVPDLHHRHPHA